MSTPTNEFKLEENVSLRDAANQVSSALPAGWSVQIEIEEGAMTFAAIDPEGEEHKEYPTNHESPEEELGDVVAYVIATEIAFQKATTA